MNATSLFERVPIERVREYWNRMPCNIRHSPKPVGSHEYFDEVEARKYFVEPHILRFVQFERWRGIDCAGEIATLELGGQYK
ncbi:MAG TPA: hypothetical protein VGT03_06210 [Candidatus Acidoferrales bacterium]|nr:hypothetical protein [Candidatus Acidoferrales bacterium]